MTLSKEQIQQVDDLPREKVSVPEWKGEVWVRAMNGIERRVFEKALADESTNLRGLIAALTICDENGNRQWADKEAEILGKKSAVALDRVVSVALRLSALGQAEVEAIEKN